jgi:catechol 2,3-dioxygenase-like lactoylglutathione lyase family enzyme
MNAARAPATAVLRALTGDMPTTQPAAAGTAVGAVSGPVPISSAVPILPSPDLDRSLAFYAYLGFTLLGRTEDYLRVALDDVELHFYLDPGLEPVANSAGCYLRLAEPEAQRAAWNADGVACLDMPGSEAYGRTLFAVVDPGGNTLRIGPLPVTAQPTQTAQYAKPRRAGSPQSQITEAP